jgi:TM2 domain-containing membrane protein YozV
MRYFLAWLPLLYFCTVISAHAEPGPSFPDSTQVISTMQLQQLSDSILASQELSFAEKSFWINDGIKILQRLTRENRKITAAILTVTLGMLGVHRLYLGTKPWVPAVYLFTFGGCFFILPFIDLVVILFSKDMQRFEDNGRLFMWTKTDAQATRDKR